MSLQQHAFSMATYERIIRQGLDRGYAFVTLSEFVARGCPDTGHFIVRHDVDKSPLTLAPIVDVESKMGIRSTTYVRVAGAEYNPLSYPAMKVFKDAESRGTELGLHTSCFEYAQLMNLDAYRILKGELDALRAFFDVKSIAPHRDINYVHNTLPFLDENWSRIRKELKVDFHAYEKRIIDSTTYVNEGFNPHLCWRSITPFDAIERGGNRSIYLLTHPHWWFKDHPFEGP